MRNVSILLTALETVEERLREPMSTEGLAKVCYSSYSGLEKLFSYAFHCSVSEYITKRRLTCASSELLSTNRSVTDIALDYQYGSPEAFSRAFKRFWGISPNEFRKTRRFTELLPKFTLELDNGGIKMSARKPLDVSGLYDELKKLGGSYVLSADIMDFAQINEDFGRSAGDLVIAEAFARLEREINENMLLFRTGGDEFAAVTGFASELDAERLAKEIVGRNGETVKFGAHNIPISLRIGISRVPEGTLNYNKALDIMSASVDKARLEQRDIAVYTG